MGTCGTRQWASLGNKKGKILAVLLESVICISKWGKGFLYSREGELGIKDTFSIAAICGNSAQNVMILIRQLKSYNTINDHYIYLQSAIT